MFPIPLTVFWVYSPISVNVTLSPRHSFHPQPAASCHSHTRRRSPWFPLCRSICLSVCNTPAIFQDSTQMECLSESTKPPTVHMGTHHRHGLLNFCSPLPLDSVYSRSFSPSSVTSSQSDKQRAGQNESWMKTLTLWPPLTSVSWHLEAPTCGEWFEEDSERHPISLCSEFAG